MASKAWERGYTSHWALDYGRGSLLQNLLTIMEETSGLLSGKKSPGTTAVLFTKNGDKSGSVRFQESPALHVATTSGESATGRTVFPQLNGRSSVYGAVFIVINAAFGAGLLAFPYSFFLAGGRDSLVGGVVIEVAIVPFCIAGLTILSYCSEVTQACTYEMMMERMWGTWARVLLEICIAIYCFGACVTYLVVIGNQFEDISSAFEYDNRSLSEQWFVSRQFLVPIVSLLLIFPWLLLKTIGLLTYTSFLSVVSCITISVMVTVKYIIGYNPGDCTLNRDIPSSCEWDWSDSLNAIPIVCFAYQCHVSCIPVYSGIKPKHRKPRNFFIIAVIAQLSCLIVYSFVGIFGYLTFFPRECVNSDILRNYCPSDIDISIARVLLTIVLITSYPILHFCGRLSIDSAIMRFVSVVTKPSWSRRIDIEFSKLPRWFPGPERWRAWTESVVWMVLSVILALFVPQVKYVISPMGCLAGLFILVFPGMNLLKLTFARFKFDWTGKLATVVLGSVMVVFGIFVFGNSLTYNVLDEFDIDI